METGQAYLRKISSLRVKKLTRFVSAVIKVSLQSHIAIWTKLWSGRKFIQVSKGIYKIKWHRLYLNRLYLNHLYLNCILSNNGSVQIIRTSPVLKISQGNECNNCFCHQYIMNLLGSPSFQSFLLSSNSTISHGKRGKIKW